MGWGEGGAGEAVERARGMSPGRAPSSTRGHGGTGTRFKGQVKGHNIGPKTGNKGTVLWTEAEDMMLQKLVDKLGTRKWTAIAREFPGKLGKQCRRRWQNHLSPGLVKGSWTEEEDAMLLEHHARLGNRWTQIARAIGGRTDNAVKNRYFALVRHEDGSLVGAAGMTEAAGRGSGPAAQDRRADLPASTSGSAGGGGGGRGRGRRPKPFISIQLPDEIAPPLSRRGSGGMEWDRFISPREFESLRAAMRNGTFLDPQQLTAGGLPGTLPSEIELVFDQISTSITQSGQTQRGGVDSLFNTQNSIGIPSSLRDLIGGMSTRGTGSGTGTFEFLNSPSGGVGGPDDVLINLEELVAHLASSSASAGGIPPASAEDSVRSRRSPRRSPRLDRANSSDKYDFLMRHFVSGLDSIRGGSTRAAAEVASK